MLSTFVQRIAAVVSVVLGLIMPYRVFFLLSPFRYLMELEKIKLIFLPYHTETPTIFP